ncbi:MAG: flagellar basal body rod protein FlgB [Vicinamibacterales bacterium]|jgi:flagellar basal-body rod protein FlgB
MAIVSDITDGAILTALRRQMSAAVQRQSAAASNLANLETPGYRTRDASFAEALNAEIGSLSTTHAGHMGGSTEAGRESTLQETEGLASRRDGNNVQLDRELIALNRASGDFSAAQTALAAKFRLVRYAINEGR